MARRDEASHGLRRIASRRRVLIAVGLAGALGLAAVAGVSTFRAARFRGRLPSLPEWSREPSELRARLTEADRTARAAPTSGEAVGALGFAYHANLYFAQADTAYALAEELDGSEWRWTYNHALVHEVRGDVAAAAASLRSVVVRASHHSPAWWRLGDAEFKLGRLDAASDAWAQARRLPDPPPLVDPAAPPRRTVASISAYAGLGLARVALARGNTDQARVLLEEVIAAAPSFGPAVRLLGTAYTSLGREEDAVRTARRAERLPGYDPYVDPTFAMLVRESRSPTFLLQQAAAADAGTNGQWREYLARRALELDPGNADALFELATLLRVLRRFEEALPLLTRLQQLTPDDFQVVADIGRCFSGLRRYGEAEAMLRRALNGLDDANTRYDLGLVLDRTGRPVEAMAEYRRALERNPTHRDALNNLGVMLARGGRLNESLQLFERLVDADPANADARANLGALLLSSALPERAAAEFRAALDIDPEHAVARDALAKTKFPNVATDRDKKRASER
jgi:tetratricopeptide (TPR) repeat protein